ncbi:hypothetical protein [Polaribacter sp.]|uniref:hypothetical protein n=1 Tax=Polaribacter sp. TaxID=1920175 RepID=UPI003F6C53E2
MHHFSQNAINFSLHQDLRLLAFGDQLGNKAGTLNFMARLKYEAEDKELGFFVGGLEFEKALLKQHYSRFGGYGGFTFMDVFNDFNFQITPTIGAGFIQRYQKNLFSWSGSVQFEYLINNSLKLSFINQITERTDLEYMYKDLKYRYSFFIGLEIRLFQLKKG